MIPLIITLAIAAAIAAFLAIWGQVQRERLA